MFFLSNQHIKGAQWFIGGVLDSKLRDCEFEPNWRKTLTLAKYWYNPGRTEKKLLGHKESNQTKINSKNGQTCLKSAAKPFHLNTTVFKK